MWSEFLVTDPPMVDQARSELQHRGYKGGSGITYRGPIVAVEHPHADLRLVEEIVRGIDPDARRY